MALLNVPPNDPLEDFVLPTPSNSESLRLRGPISQWRHTFFRGTARVSLNYKPSKLHEHFRFLRSRDERVQQGVTTLTGMTVHEQEGEKMPLWMIWGCLLVPLCQL